MRGAATQNSYKEGVRGAASTSPDPFHIVFTLLTCVCRVACLHCVYYIKRGSLACKVVTKLKRVTTALENVPKEVCRLGAS